MRNQIRIPTLLGLGIILTGLTIGVLLVVHQQSIQTKASGANTPQNIQVGNSEANSVTVSWQTDSPVTGFVQAGPQPALGLTFKDDRDGQDLDTHYIHIVTMKNLQPQTMYYFKIVSGGVTFPETQPMTLSTAATLPPQPMAPLIGSVLDVTGKPVTEALLTLEADGAQKLITYTKTAASFIIPLATLKTPDLTTPILITDSTPKNALLTISSPGQSSKIKITLPYHDATLPPITIGKDLDLTTPPPASGPAQTTNKFDLNGDGILNSADRAIILSNAGKKNFDKKADLNNDGVVDQKDLDLFNQELSHQSS